MTQKKICPARGGAGLRELDLLAERIEREDYHPPLLPQARFLVHPDLIREGMILARRDGRVTVRWPNGTGAWLLVSCIVADDDADADLFTWGLAA